MGQMFISAAHKSSGKTTVSIGLCRALVRRGLIVTPFKKGPDYIDPMWLGRAAQQPCYNLDFNTMGQDELTATFARHSRRGHIALIEGNKGLYDGLDLDGSNSNAALARLLNSPVVLVIDARGMTRGIAPLILGYQAFDPKVRIAGVILNQLGGHRHESKLRAVIEHYTDVPLIGALQHDRDLELPERHLGLIPSNEVQTANAYIDTLADRIAQQVDLDSLLSLSGVRAPIETAVDPNIPHVRPDLRIGVARDSAFGFYYPDDLDALRAAGAALVFFDTLKDTRLPHIDALFIGGGFPETQMQALEANVSLRHEIRDAIQNGLPTYAECGGLMYLSRSITWQSRRHAMVGAIAGDTVMYDRPQGRGYIQLRETEQHPWPKPASPGAAHHIAAHEFHYSRLENIGENVRFAYQVVRGTGIDGEHDGIVSHNVLGCYAHLRHVSANPWATRFVEFARRHRHDAHSASSVA